MPRLWVLLLELQQRLLLLEMELLLLLVAGPGVGVLVRAGRLQVSGSHWACVSCKGGATGEPGRWSQLLDRLTQPAQQWLLGTACSLQLVRSAAAAAGAAQGSVRHCTDWLCL